MLLKQFDEYRNMSTNKTATGMSDSMYKSIGLYVNKFAQSYNKYDYDTFRDYISNLDVAVNTKSWIAHSMGRFLWIFNHITDSEFKRLKTTHRFQNKNWSDKHISNDMLMTIVNEISINSKNEFILTRNLFMTALLSLTGLRISQICDINVQDLIFNDKSIIVSIIEKKRNSNDLRGQKRQITIPIQTKFLKFSLFDLFIDYRANMIKKDNPEQALFISGGGHRLAPRTMQLLYQSIGDKHNFKITPHTFRHEAITRAVNKHGINVGAILAGHASYHTTKRYVNPEQVDISKVFLTYNEEQI